MQDVDNSATGKLTPESKIAKTEEALLQLDKTIVVARKRWCRMLFKLARKGKEVAQETPAEGGQTEDE